MCGVGIIAPRAHRDPPRWLVVFCLAGFAVLVALLRGWLS